MDNKKKYGQYFTTNKTLREKVVGLIRNSPKTILEPSSGQGDLIQEVKLRYPKITFDAYEIDNTIPVLSEVSNIKYQDFLQVKFRKKYHTIIGNPPFVKTESGNLYLDFIKKCYQLLNPNGELIFIVPSDFLKLTSASKIILEMMENGSFTDIYHPNDERIFADANIDIILFRYQKSKELDKKVIYNDKELFIQNNKGILTFTETEKSQEMMSSLFDIYVGIVSGKDEIYKNDQLGNISVLTGENKNEKFIYLTSFPSNQKELDKYLEDNKKVLMERKIKNFNEKNWFEWGAPRNIKLMEKLKGKDCIYIYNLTRKDKVAFKGKVEYFGGNLLIMIPKNPNQDLDKTINYLNSDKFKKNYLYSGRFKIGQRQLACSNLE